MTIFRTIGLLSVAFCVAIGSPAAAEGIVVHDARNRDVVIDNPARIVSIGGAITEILYALGFDDRVAGVDATSLYPADALRDKPNVGYMRQLSPEGVLGLNPSLVLAVQGSGPKETMDVLETAKVPLVLVPETFSEQGLLDKIRLVGHAMGADRRAECLTAAVADDLAHLRELRARVTKPVRVMFVMSLLNGRAMAAGEKTAANEIIRLAGAVNAIEGYDGYKTITDEAIVAAKPDVGALDRARQGYAGGRSGLRPSGLRTDAGSCEQILHFHGGPLSPRLRTAHGRRRARPFVQALSGTGAAGQKICARRTHCKLPAMTALVEDNANRAARRVRRSRRPGASLTILCLLLALAGAALIALTVGAAGIPFARLPAALGLWTDASPDPLTTRDQLVLWSIRIPRIAAAAMVGGLLAVSGAIMQGLFRNPLADPALVGVSSGGAFAAAAAIVLIDSQIGENLRFMQNQLLPLAAFAGSLVTTIILYGIASRSGRTSIAIFLLAGLAIAAIANAGIGMVVFIADDRQLRDITFWMLGSLSGATWTKTATLAPVLALGAIACLWIARGLDVLVLGEAEAFHSGVDVERLKRISIVLVSAMTGVAVSVCGVVGFVGIVVPHLLRLAIGPAHRLLLPASMLFGAVLLVGADTMARTIVAPAEMPIGILTAAIGAPFFLGMLLRQRGLVSL